MVWRVFKVLWKKSVLRRDLNEQKVTVRCKLREFKA